MKAFKYFKIDMKRSKTQFICMSFFGIVSYMFVRGEKSLLMGFGYILFAAVIMQASCFTNEQKNETGFINMLPGSDKDRVVGRFIMGVLFLLVGLVFLSAGFLVLKLQGNLTSDYLLEAYMIFTGAGLSFIAIQNVFLYAVGKNNSILAMNYIRLIPGLVLWVAITIFASVFEGERMLAKIAWLKDNMLLISGILLTVGIILTVLGVVASEKIVDKKDYA